MSKIGLKYLITAISLFLVSSASFANSNDRDNMYVSQVLRESEPSAGNVSPTIKEHSTEKKSEIDLKAETKVDSSYYSVSKFNFLFYLMYKLKYTETDQLEETLTEQSSD